MVMGWLEFLWLIIWPTYFRLWVRNPGVLWQDLMVVVSCNQNMDEFWLPTDLAFRVQYLWTTTMSEKALDAVNRRTRKMREKCLDCPMCFDKYFARIPAYHELTSDWSRSCQGELHDRISKYVLMVQVMLFFVLYFVGVRYPALHLVLSLVCTAAIDKGMPFYIPNLTFCTLLAPYALYDAIMSTFMTQYLKKGIMVWFSYLKFALPATQLLTVSFLWRSKSESWQALFHFQFISMAVTTLYAFVGYCHCPSQPLGTALTLILLQMASLSISQQDGVLWASLIDDTKAAFFMCLQRTIDVCMILALCGCVINLARKARAYEEWEDGWLRKNVLDRCMCYHYSKMYETCTFHALLLNFCSTIITAYFVYDARFKGTADLMPVKNTGTADLMPVKNTPDAMLVCGTPSSGACGLQDQIDLSAAEATARIQRMWGSSKK